MNAIADHLWQSTLFAGIVWLLTLALRRNRARVRHGVWLAASIKFLIPFSLFVALGGLVPRQAAPAITAPAFVVMDQVSQPFAAPAVAVTVLPAPSSLPEILLSIWTCGFIGITCAWWVRWRRIQAAVRAGTSVNLNIPIKAMSSPTLLEPGVFGIFRPVLLLPNGIFERLTPAQLQPVIAHELCHVRHRDNLIAAIHMFVETVFWFHPLVWWIGKRMVEERERACDEEVLRDLADPKAYAEGILNVCKLYVESPLRCVSGVTGSNLRKRIEAIMTNRAALRLNLANKAALAATLTTALAIPVVVGMMHAQSPAAATLKFEVASIKPTDPAFSGRSLQMLVGDSIVTIKGMSLKDLIRYAWGASGLGLHPSRVTGGPSWFDRDRYDVVAKSAGFRIPSQDERKQMLRALLSERFQLTFHREPKEIAVYELTVGKNGPKMKERTPDDGGAPFSMLLKGFHLPGRSASMAELANLLESLIPITDPERDDRPVLDQTGLVGRFDFELTWAPDSTRSGGQGGPTGGSANAPDLFTAVQEQLGLKLEPARAPVDILVIDHVERPSEN